MPTLTCPTTNHKETTMNPPTITRPLALIAAGALALTGCAAAEPAPVKTVYVEAEPKPAPVETVHVTPEPEPAPVMEDGWTESDDFIQLVLEMAWADTDAEDRESICWGIDILGENWFLETWDEETSGAPAPLAFEFLEGKCA